MERTRRSEFKTCFICNAICTLIFMFVGIDCLVANGFNGFVNLTSFVLAIVFGCFTVMSYNVYRKERRWERSAEMNMLLEQRAEQ